VNREFFPYELDQRWFVLFKVLGVGPEDGVTLTEDELIATYGRFRVQTPRANIDDTLITGPHRWYTAVGIRASFADDGLTFGTNHRRGLCITFAEKIRRVIGMQDHSALWVSVADPEGLDAAISSVRKA
jgi:hypothetical protein